MASHNKDGYEDRAMSKFTKLMGRSKVVNIWMCCVGGHAWMDKVLGIDQQCA